MPKYIFKCKKSPKCVARFGLMQIADHIHSYIHWPYFMFLGVAYPESKVHGANMGPTWVLLASDGPHVGPMKLAIRVLFIYHLPTKYKWSLKHLHNSWDEVYVAWKEFHLSVYGSNYLKQNRSMQMGMCKYWMKLLQFMCLCMDALSMLTWDGVM